MIPLKKKWGYPMKMNGKIYKGRYPSRKQVEVSMQIMATSVPVDLSNLYPLPNTPLDRQLDFIIFALAVWGEGMGCSHDTRRLLGECLLHQWMDRQEQIGESLRDFLFGYHVNHDGNIRAFKPGHVMFNSLFSPPLTEWLPLVSLTVPLLIHPPFRRMDSPYYYVIDEYFGSKCQFNGSPIIDVDGVRFYTKESISMFKTKGCTVPSS